MNKNEILRKKFVESGCFDKVPQRELHVGEIVAVRHSGLSSQILAVSERSATVSYPKDGKEITEDLPLTDIRGYEEFFNGFLGFLGVIQDFHLGVDDNNALLLREDRLS